METRWMMMMATHMMMGTTMHHPMLSVTTNQPPTM
jgi:hypothetical protein